MRIVFVDTTCHEELIGGGHLILPALMSALQKKGHEVHLVVQDTPNPKLSALIEDSNAIVHIRPWKKKGLVADVAPYFNSWLTQLNPDVYVISGSADIGWVVLPLLHPVIATFAIGHNNEETFYAPARHYHPFLSTAIGVSQEICRQFVYSSNMPPDKVEWIPYGVECVDDLPAANYQEPIRMVYVGRVVEEQKRISDVIEIIKKLGKAGTEFSLSVVGDGPEMPRFREELKIEIEKGQVHLKGWLSKPEVLAILRVSDVFLLTSSYEGFSIALTEAMANGCCPVITDIKAGNQQLVSNMVDGYLVEVGNTDSFVYSIQQLSLDRNKLYTIRKSAWIKGGQYSISRMAEAYEMQFKAAKLKCLEYPRRADFNFPLMSSCVSKYPSWLRRIKYSLTGK